ncbi:MAG: serine hydrolase domain-containing protein [Longimicrobiales bacterium]
MALTALAVLAGSASGSQDARSLADGLLIRPPVEAPGAPAGPVEARMTEASIPGLAVAVLQGGRVAWAGGWGRTRPDGPPVDARTPFQVASLSKPVTAAAVLTLADEGLLDLDADVNTVVPGLARSPSGAAVDGVTPHRLLRHSAGVGTPGFPGTSGPLPELDDVLDGRSPATVPPIRVEAPPGDLTLYSGGGYVLLQRLVEAVVGRPFAEVVGERLLLPLGMADSDYADPEPGPGAEGRAAGHDRAGGPLPEAWRRYAEDAAAGLWSTAADMGRFLEGLHQAGAGADGPLPPAVAAEMGRPIPVRMAGGAPTWGAGWEIHGQGAATYLSITGNNPGYRARMVWFPATGDGVVVLTNADRGGPVIDDVVRGIAVRLAWPALQPRRVAAGAVPEEALASVPGHYRFGPADLVIEVAVRDGALALKLPWSDFVALRPVGDGRWVAADGADVTFGAVEDGQVRTITVVPPGQAPLDGVREPG